jgi:hypothetical protein
MRVLKAVDRWHCEDIGLAMFKNFYVKSISPNSYVQIYSLMK